MPLRSCCGALIHLKGERALNGKSALTRRGPAPPGQHGQARRRRPSIYATQLRQEQRLKRYYGSASGSSSATSARRRGAVRAGWATTCSSCSSSDSTTSSATRAQARQFVTHGHVLVDGRKVDIPSYSSRPGRRIAIRIDSPVGRMLREPRREEIPTPVEEQPIVEYFARR